MKWDRARSGGVRYRKGQEHHLFASCSIGGRARLRQPGMKFSDEKPRKPLICFAAVLFLCSRFASKTPPEFITPRRDRPS
jgi:hypothetical protein